jgi:hypothetical protein
MNTIYNDLSNLAIKHGTDKWNADHSHCNENYLHVYERYLREFRELPINFLELGVKGGHSLRLWQEYFPNAQIYGVDINPNCIAHSAERIHTHVASQDDKDFLLELSEKAGGFDIILDDASHINSLIISSFNILYDTCLKSSGIYIIEDLGNSYIDLAPHAGTWDGELIVNRDRGVPLSHSRSDLDDLFLSLIKRCDVGDASVKSVHFWSKLSIITKGK